MSIRKGEIIIAGSEAIPSQSGQSGKFLKTNGTELSWDSVDALPSQSGQSGKFLTTNGSSASWKEIEVGSASDNKSITKNVDERLQAVGIINKRDPDLVTGVWTGKNSEWNNGGTLDFYNWSQTPLSSWSTTTLPFVPNQWSKIQYNNGTYLVTQINREYAYSTDNMQTWQTGTMPDTGAWSIYWGCATVCNGKFFVLDNYSDKVAVSTDAINWSLVQFQPTSGLSSVVWNEVKTFGNTIVAVGGYSSSTNYGYSLDGGTTWQYGTNLPISRTWKSIAYGNGTYVMTCSGKDIIYSTDNMQTWHEADTTLSTNTSIRYVEFGKGKFVALASYSDEVMTSTDGINWTYSKRKSTFNNSICFNGDVFTAVASGDGFLYSSDGINWNLTKVPATTAYWSAHNFVNGKYVLETSSGTEFAIHEGSFFNVYTLDRNPTVDSTLYNSPADTSKLYITSITGDTLTLSDGNEYVYNQSGNTSMSGTVGDLHPNTVSYITDQYKIKVGNTIVADKVLNSNDKIDAYRLASNYGTGKYLTVNSSNQLSFETLNVPNIQVVSELPSTPVEGVIYIVTG